MSMAKAENGPPHLAFDRVEVYYSALVAGLKGVSLSIERGEFVFLCGQTGSGKSTLLKLITREVRETKGQVSLLGRDLGQLPDREIPYLRRQMGIVPQDYGLLPNKKVWENVAYAMRAVNRSKREVRAKVPQILEQVNIMHRADAFPYELSGGEQQRVAIARALINDPPLLIADEPTGNLDPTHSAEIMALLSRLNEQGTTIIVATHDIPIVQRLQQRVVELEFGTIVGDTAAGETWSPNISSAEYTTFEEKETDYQFDGEEFEIYLEEPSPEAAAEETGEPTHEEETPRA
ncbi:MAG: ATP-binding cassette domain-containing protein [Fimbriimonadaceae bacterium]|jgi:cell division transport system ATP-binding protein|nr:ATP-binding cassette domain-containing protein [Fimbriimonadaceae bacterium]